VWKVLVLLYAVILLAGLVRPYVTDVRKIRIVFGVLAAVAMVCVGTGAWLELAASQKRRDELRPLRDREEEASTRRLAALRELREEKVEFERLSTGWQGAYTSFGQNSCLALKLGKDALEKAGLTPEPRPVEKPELPPDLHP
jgi:hypothetical protein